MNSEDYSKRLERFCKRYISEYVNCVRINNTVFGSEHGPKMCEHIKEIIELTGCDISKYTEYDSIEDLNKLV